MSGFYPLCRYILYRGRGIRKSALHDHGNRRYCDKKAKSRTTL